jgi:hypothetical protein
VAASNQLLKIRTPDLLAQPSTEWPAERLVAIWNSLAGVKPVKGFKSAKAAAGRIWEHIQNLGEMERTQGQGWRTGGHGYAREGKGD